MNFAFVPFFLAVAIVTHGASETRVAVAHLESQDIRGTILFLETVEGVRVTGTITGLPVGQYGFHIHEFGDVSTCDAAGAHYNPYGNPHGAREDQIRHVGDLGNIAFVADVDSDSGIANVDFIDTVISLRGLNNILGRTLMLHEKADDLGLGEDEASLTTGNAGGRVACAVIGIQAPAAPWDE